MIDAAILFALLSLVFGGLNEVVFKRYSAKMRSRGMMICGIGIVWTLLLLADVAIRGSSIEVNASGLIYGTIAGLVVALANILLLESLRHMEVSLGSTIYRLNTIAVVVLSILFLGEGMTAAKLSGIVCGVVAVLLLYRHQRGLENPQGLRLGLYLVVSGPVARGLRRGQQGGFECRQRHRFIVTDRGSVLGAVGSDLRPIRRATLRDNASENWLFDPLGLPGLRHCANIIERAGAR